MKKLPVLLIALIIIGGIFTACTEALGSSSGLQVKEVWARPGQAGSNSAIYFVIDNNGEGDTLLSATCEAAGITEMHMSKMDGDTMMMQPQENVPIPANEQVKFEPGGLHVMLMDLKNDVKAGDKLPITLTFEKAGTVETEASVREP